jgi:sugar/nucleoside kinase (ribokinase family)
MSNDFDLITVGDSTIDTFIKIHDASVECGLNKKDCRICIQYGSKIPVDEIAHSVAGNAANVAVAGSKLGLKTGIYTNLGGDVQGETIKESLEKAGVALDFVKINPKMKSNLSVVLTFQGERTIFVYHQDWQYKLPNLPNCKWLYLTSMSETFTNSNIFDEIHRYVAKSGAKLAFGPGTYQLKADIKRFPKILENCELLIVNLEEAKRVLGLDQSSKTDEKDILAKLLLLGPKRIAVTDGEEGSFATDGKTNLKLGIFPTQILEKTGAGDAYSAGFLAALCYGLPFAEAMVWGTINASGEIRQVGTQQGIMDREKLERYRKAVPELAAVPF